jgi:hypothetical protein
VTGCVGLPIPLQIVEDQYIVDSLEVPALLQIGVVSVLLYVRVKTTIVVWEKLKTNHLGPQLPLVCAVHGMSVSYF